MTWNHLDGQKQFCCMSRISSGVKSAHGRYFGRMRKLCTVTNKVAPLYPVSREAAMEEITPETAGKLSDANEESVKKKPGRPRLLGTSPNIVNHWRTSLYQFLIVLRKY